jgi:hypothetical protein
MNFDALDSLVLASPGFAPEPVQIPTPHSSFDHPGASCGPALRPKQPQIPNRPPAHTPPDKQSRVITAQTHTPQPSIDASITPVVGARSHLSSIERTIASLTGEGTVLRNVNRDTFNELESLIMAHEHLEKCPS